MTNVFFSKEVGTSLFQVKFVKLFLDISDRNFFTKMSALKEYKKLRFLKKVEQNFCFKRIHFFLQVSAFRSIHFALLVCWVSVDFVTCYANCHTQNQVNSFSVHGGTLIYFIEIRFRIAVSNFQIIFPFPNSCCSQSARFLILIFIRF